MVKYLVIGIYEDDHSRFAQDIEAETPEAAEQEAIGLYPGLIVAGVIDPATCEVVT